jgi:hypothetical protein
LGDKIYKAKSGLWKLFILAHTDEIVVTEVDKQMHKKVLTQKHAHKVDHHSKGRKEANKGPKHTDLI